MSGPTKISVRLVQQAVWDMPMESMPLAAGYLKATALADERLDAAMDIGVVNFGGGVGLPAMADRLFGDGVPDVLAFSVLGWNYRAFGALAETFKQLNPDGWVVFGGTHVAGQAERVFRMHPEVDVIANGEGELTFRDLLLAYLDGRSRDDLGDVAGVSYRGPGGIATTADRDRIEDLDVIPSPVLTGAIDLTHGDGRFRYDVALMETNRGCPYKCSFCYWGGAVGQRVRAFSRERLRREVELFARLKVYTIALCDANFGLLPIDEEFVDDVIEIRAKYGYPKAIESSWAKNKSQVFYRIVRKMKEAGLRSSFTLALQTLSDDALREMNRRNMKVNQWDDLVAWLGKEGLECYAELIWGAPGETVESFLKGYDRLAAQVPRIAVYPILLLPNTAYSEKKKEYGIVSVRGDQDDFEYVLAHDTMSFADNRRMQRFLFWSRVMADASVLRHSWRALDRLGGITQSQALLNLDEWIRRDAGPAAETLRAAVTTGTLAPGPAIEYLFRAPEAKDLLMRWWRESVRPLLPPDAAGALDEVFRYDLLTQPVYQEARTAGGAGGKRDGGALFDGGEVSTVQVGGEEYLLRARTPFRHDVPAILAALRAGEEPDLAPSPVTVDLYYRTGVETWATTTNSEEIVYFRGMTAEELAVLEKRPA